MIPKCGARKSRSVLITTAIFVTLFVGGDFCANVLADDICVETTLNMFGNSVAGKCDVNGDGIYDVLVGAPDFLCAGGKVYVYNGVNNEVMAILEGENSYDAFGFCVAGVGDVNNDGKDEFIVGAPKADPDGIEDAGKAYVYTYDENLDEFVVISSRAGNDPFQQLGRSVAGEDGYIIIGSPGETDGRGMAEMFHGIPISGAEWYFQKGDDDRDSLGIAVAAGDFNNDNKPDFAFSAPFDDASFLIWDVGEVVVINGYNKNLMCRLRGEALTGGGVFGYSIAFGNFDGDKYNDLVVGAPGVSQQKGAVYAYRGPLGTVFVDYKISGEQSGDWFGYSVAAVGSEIHSKGKAHLAIGAPRALDDDGNIYLYHLKFQKLVYKWKILDEVAGTYEDGRFGRSVADYGRSPFLRCDNFVLVGAPKAGVLFHRSGRAMLMCNDGSTTDLLHEYNPADQVPLSKPSPGDDRKSQGLALSAYPNPFNPTTVISFALPKGSQVRLEVFDILGRKVTTLADEYLEAGPHSYSWDGSRMSSGIYLYRLKTDNKVANNKMLLLK